MRLFIPHLVASIALAGGVAVSSAAGAPMVEHAKKGVKAGQFCKTADAGKVRRATNGAKVKCVKVKGRYRWRNA